LNFREDITNISDKYFRNRIRHQILPFLIEHSQCDIIENLSFLGKIAEEDESFFDSLIGKEFELCKIDTDHLSVSLRSLKEMKPSLRKRFIYNMLSRFEIYPERSQIERIEEILDNSGRISLKNNIDLWLDEDSQTLHLGEYPSRFRLSSEYVIVDEGKTIIEPLSLEVSSSKHIHSPEVLEIKNKNKRPERIIKPWKTGAFFDADSIVGRMKIRFWNHGDRMVPFGMKGSKKLQDIFTDEKVSVFERDRWPILCDDKGILWVIGLCQDERTRVTDKTRITLYIEVKSSGIEKIKDEIA